MVSVGMWEWMIWSGMTGVLSVLALVSALDVAVQRNMAAARGLMFILLTGGAAVVMCGIPEQIWPGRNPGGWLLLKSTLGPLSGALALHYLALWVDAAQEDIQIRQVGRWGSLFLVLAAAVLGAVMLGWQDIPPQTLLESAGAINLASVALAILIAVRASRLGDHLARWMVLACVSLAFMVLGLYAKGLGWVTDSPAIWLLTALATVGYFLIVIALTILRTREQRRLRRAARGLVEMQVDLPMAQGAHLVPRIEDAIWRAQRMQRHCVVVAVSIRNLYEHGALVSTGAEGHILAAMAARIRRKVGFRNVVGLYHPRCFILAISSGQDPRRGVLDLEGLMQELRISVPVRVDGELVQFEPVIGVGVVPVEDPSMTAIEAINEAERLSFVEGMSVSKTSVFSETLPPPPPELMI